MDAKNEYIAFSKTNRKTSNFEKEIKDKAADIEESCMLSFKGTEQLNTHILNILENGSILMCYKL